MWGCSPAGVLSIARLIYVKDYLHTYFSTIISIISVVERRFAILLSSYLAGHWQASAYPIRKLVHPLLKLHDMLPVRYNRSKSRSLFNHQRHPRNIVNHGFRVHVAMPSWLTLGAQSRLRLDDRFAQHGTS